MRICFTIYKKIQWKYLNWRLKTFCDDSYGPSGMAIHLKKPVSILISGNSSERPLHIQVSASSLITIRPSSNAELTSFWKSLRDIKNEGEFLHLPV
jgi:hypothetical protein